jgi:hypothetical protein
MIVAAIIIGVVSLLVNGGLIVHMLRCKKCRS